MRKGAIAVPALLLASLSFAGAAFGAAGETSGDATTPVSTLDLSFELYAGGIRLGHAGISARVQGTDYKAISTLETRGLVNAFWQSKIETSSSGELTARRVQPSLYDSFSQYRANRRRHVTLTFGPEGPKVVSDPPYPENHAVISEAQKKEALDPLSAVMYLIGSHSNEAKPCEATAPIFDGRRRYDVSFDFIRKARINMDNGLYDGPGYVCRVHYNQVAGYQQTLVQQGKKLPTIFAWVAPVKSADHPSLTYMLPLRIWAETEYGIVVALASQVKLDGGPLPKQN